MQNSKIQEKMKKNIWLFYLYRVFCSFTLVGPIFILFLLDNNLTMFQIGILQTVYTLTIMLLNIPSGLLTDKLGRKTVLVSNTFFFVGGWIIYAFSYTFWSFFIAEVLIGIASALWVASGSTFVYDTLLSIKEEATYKRIQGNITAINYGVWGTAALVGSYLATYSLRLPFYLTIIPVTLALLISFAFKEPLRHKKKDIHYIAHLKDAVRFSAMHPKIRMLIAYSAIIAGVGFSVFILYQPYLQSISIPIIYFGVIYFAMNIVSALMAKYAHKMESKLGEKLSLVAIVLIKGIAIAFMALKLKWIGAIFPIIGFGMGGFAEPVLNDYMHRHISSLHRGTVMALSNFASNLSASIIMPFLGFLVDFWSLSFAFLLAAAIILLNIIFLYFMYRNHLPKTDSQ